MDRWLAYDQEQLRSFDVNSSVKDAMLGLAWLTQDLLGSTSTVVAGFAPAATGSLAINLGAGRTYELASADATAVAGGDLPIDTTQIMQQGSAAAQSVTLSTTGLIAGQSRWALIQTTFTQVDVIRPLDPQGGLLDFFNSSDPDQPLQGQAGNGLTLPTMRRGVATVSILYGNPATTGSEIPPQPTTGYVPLYLVDLAFGQTVVTSGQILVAGPSVGTGVPNNYPAAPFLIGLLNLQTPRIRLTQNTTFYVNTAGSDANNGLSTGAPWQTLQHVIDVLTSKYDFNGFTVTIVGTGAFTAGAIQSVPWTGAASPGGVVFSFTTGSTVTSTNSSCFSATGAGCGFNVVTASGTLVVLAASGTGSGQGCGLYADLGGQIAFQNVNFGVCAAAHQYSANGARIAPAGSYTISGNAPYHIFCQAGGKCQYLATPMTVTLTGTPAFTAFAVATDSGGSIICPSGSVTFSGAATGARYSVVLNATINTVNGGGANFFPGNAPGTPGTGGQYG